MNSISEFQLNMRKSFNKQYNEKINRLDLNETIGNRNLVGIETEYLIVDDNYKLVAEEIRNNIVKSHTFLKKELGASQIEINSDPVSLKYGYKDLLSDIKFKEKLLVSEANKYNCQILRMGMYPGSVNDILITNDHGRYNDKLDTIREIRPAYINRSIGNVELNESIHEFIGGCQSCHFNIEVSQSKAINLLNKAIELSGYYIALSASSPILDCKDTGYSEVKHALWTIGYEDRDIDGLLTKSNRVSIPNRYYRSFSDYWIDVRNQFYYTYDVDHAFEFNQKMYWKNSRLKLVGESSTLILLELRYLPTQPSAEDDIAMYLLIYGLLISHSETSNILPIHLVKENIILGSMYGIDAKLYYLNNGIVEKKSASEIIKSQLEKSLKYWEKIDINTVEFIKNSIEDKLLYETTADIERRLFNYKKYLEDVNNMDTSNFIMSNFKINY